MHYLTREQVLKILSKYRPDFSEDDWREADVISVLSWLLPYELNKAENID